MTRRSSNLVAKKNLEDHDLALYYDIAFLPLRPAPRPGFLTNVISA